MSRIVTKPVKWHMRPAKTQISLDIRPVWSASSLCAQWLAKNLSFLHADSEDSDQNGRMPRLTWVFAGRTCHFVGFVTMRLKFHCKEVCILNIHNYSETGLLQRPLATCLFRGPRIMTMCRATSAHYLSKMIYNGPRKRPPLSPVQHRKTLFQRVSNIGLGGGGGSIFVTWTQLLYIK